MTRNHSNGPCRKATTDKLLNLISREIVTFIVYIRNYFVLAVNQNREINLFCPRKHFFEKMKCDVHRPMSQLF
jgi:hypothetical protein